MTKDEMIKALQELDVPGDTEVIHDISNSQPRPEVVKIGYCMGVIIIYTKDGYEDIK